MATDHRAKLAAISDLDQLIVYLRDEMGWPIPEGAFENYDELTYDYTAEELGIDPETAAKIKSIKRLQPLSARQPWGIFFIKFEPKRLPVIALRRILGRVARKKRLSANSAEQAAWAADDLLFVSSYGDSDSRQISFAHFSQSETRDDLPTLKVLGWNDLDTASHLDDVVKELTQQLAWPADVSDADAWRRQWRGAFTVKHGEIIATSKELSIRLAELAQRIRGRIKGALRLESATGPLTKLMKAFQASLIHDLDADSFADMYAQTISYGLLSARIADPTKRTADDFAGHMRTNPFLRELMETFLKVGGRNGKAGGPGIDFDELGVNDVVELLDNANMEAVVRDFGDRNPEEDPVIHFYELFLKEYDAKKRMQRGVFYTPRPVVSYIVRSVDELLRTEFGLEDGLADTTTWGEMLQRHPDLQLPVLIPRDSTKPGSVETRLSPDHPFVQILDPATGTGTFLVEVIDIIHKTMTAKWKAKGHNATKIEALWNEYVPKHLLPRLHGYELLMAPFAIAHLKIGLRLYETGYRFGSDVRARIYLTNALEPASSLADTRAADLFEALGHEAHAVNEIKRSQPFTVVVGNPPYAGLSANLGPTSRAIVDKYRFVGDVRIKERGALQFEKNIQDDYVKFIAWSEATATATGVGLLAFISNNGFLDSPTLRGMRWHISQTFTHMSFLDLRGSTKRPIVGDENVFDIQQGVAISILSRGLAQAGILERSTHTADLVGTRDMKYAVLARSSIRATTWRSIVSLPPFFQFLPLDRQIQLEYSAYDSLLDIMPFYSTGTETGFDSLMVDFSTAELLAKLEGFLDPNKTDAQVEDEYSVGKGTSRKLLDMRSEFRRDFERNGPGYCTPGMYRVFDRRVYYFKKDYLKTNSLNVMQHLSHQGNRALVAFRQQSQDGFQHAFVTQELSDKNAVSLRTREVNYYFPLYVFPEAGGLALHAEKSENLSPQYRERLRLSVMDGIEFSATPRKAPSAEDAFNYAYAVLHSPSYRRRYAEFLKSDFPRIPMPGCLDLFVNLARHGNELVATHLMTSPSLARIQTTYVGEENPLVGRVEWTGNTVCLDATATRTSKVGEVHTNCIRGVPEAVWTFHIGGYQVCEKWLKERKGRTLSDDDIVHYQKIVVAISETIRLMKEVDEEIEKHGGWPGAFQTADPTQGRASGA